MSEIDHETPSLEELTEPKKPVGSPEYLAWAEKKIRKSIADDDANPEGRVSLDAVMQEHGVN